jgi:hypothetical protein
MKTTWMRIGWIALLLATQAAGVRPMNSGIYGGAGQANLSDTVEPLAISSRRIEKSATVYAVFAIE